ncbi:hypothetical protein BDFB_011628, partial [Asbolus verrucosus]
KNQISFQMLTTVDIERPKYIKYGAANEIWSSDVDFFLNTDDCFIIIRKLFIDFAYNKYTKLFNMICLLFQSAVYLVEIYFMIANFNLELLSRYSAQMLIFAFILTTMIVSIYLEKDILTLKNLFFDIAWSLESAGLKTRNLITKKSTIINAVIYVVFALFVFAAIICQPAFGDESELFLCVRVFREYFGVWMKIPHLLYFSTLPFMYLSSIRLAYVLIYGILQIQMQVTLLDVHILQMSSDFNHLREEEKLYSIVYQTEIYKRLCFCIYHHVALKEFITKLSATVKSVMFIFVILGILTTIGVFFLILNVVKDSLMRLQHDLKILVQNVGITLLQTGHILESLMKCTWYNWNTKNRLTLLIFIMNCMEPMKFSFAGVVLDRKLAAAVTFKQY